MNQTALYAAFYRRNKHPNLMRTPLDAPHSHAAIAKAQQRQAMMERLKWLERLATSVIFAAEIRVELKD